eukprot:6178084-Pleurochrysis_carterae.AAC.1
MAHTTHRLLISDQQQHSTTALPTRPTLRHSNAHPVYLTTAHMLDLTHQFMQHHSGSLQCGGRAVGRGQDITLTVFYFIVDVGLQELFQDEMYSAESCLPICSSPERRLLCSVRRSPSPCLRIAAQ